MSRKNEFLRSRPAQRNRNVLYDLSNFILPIFVVIVGLILSTQIFAKLVGYNLAYTDYPLLVTKKDFLFIDAGYPFFNPALVAANIISNPFDKTINAVLFQSFFPLLFCTGLAVLLFFIVSAVRGYQLTKSDNLYGTTRWGTERDLRKWGLTQRYGVVLAEFQKAVLDSEINPQTSGISLKLIKPSPLICHAGGTNTLMIAPTRSGKGVSSCIPTSINYHGSMILHDPKGELYNITAGYRKKFSHVLKFSPISYDTVCFNPLEEVELTEQAFADIGLILTNMFEEPKGGNDGTSNFFDNTAQTLLTGLIFHVLSSGLYSIEQKTLSGCLSILSQASVLKTDENGNEVAAGDPLLLDMMNCKHFDKYGNECEYIHRVISDAAAQIYSMHEKVRADTFQTVFTKMRLFQDPYIAYVTSRSDFKISDFYDSEAPLSLYLTVPFAHIDRIAPVFKMLINFILRKFSAGEIRADQPEKKLKNRILFLLDEFPILGHFPFINKTMGVLAGYGINFFIIVQALNQITDIYGQNHTFLDNCKTVCVFAPGKIEDAKSFTEMIGKESVLKESVSASGSRYAVALNNLNASSQEVARDLMNPDELMKLPLTEALILNQGMPAYIAKKVVYYEDKRFKSKTYSSRKKKILIKAFGIQNPFSLGKYKKGLDKEVVKIKKIIGLSIPLTYAEKIITTGFLAPYGQNEINKEIASLPSNLLKLKNGKGSTPAVHSAIFAADSFSPAAEAEFNPVDYLETYEDITGFASPVQYEIKDDEVPPKTVKLDLTSFTKDIKK